MTEPEDASVEGLVIHIREVLGIDEQDGDAIAKYLTQALLFERRKGYADALRDLADLLDNLADGNPLKDKQP